MRHCSRTQRASTRKSTNRTAVDAHTSSAHFRATLTHHDVHSDASTTVDKLGLHSLAIKGLDTCCRHGRLIETCTMDTDLITRDTGYCNVCTRGQKRVHGFAIPALTCGGWILLSMYTFSQMQLLLRVDFVVCRFCTMYVLTCLF